MTPEAATTVVLSEAEARRLSEVLGQIAATNDLLSERLAALEEPGWQRVDGVTDREFSRPGLSKICADARLYWLANPLIRRAVACQVLYVWGQGCTIRAAHEAVDDVVQAFLADPTNRTVIGEGEPRQRLETELQLFANLFFVYFTDPSTGAVKIRTIPFDEITDVISNPDDAAEPRYYRRVWSETSIGADGHIEVRPRTAYYPDWRYATREGSHLPAAFGPVPVMRDSPIYHVATNRLGDMRWGVSEVYAAIPWARGYKEFLENWATVARMLSRFALSVTTRGGNKGVAAAADRLRSLLSPQATAGSPDPIPAGGIFASGEGTKVEPLKTSGVTMSCDDARRFLLMVCSATGIFEHYLAGDPSTGNLATAKSMERPMELQFTARQSLWSSILTNILDYVIDQAALAPNGPLNAGHTEERDEDGDLVVTLATDPETGEPMDRAVEVAFPTILEHDTTAEVDAVVRAATLGGQGTDAGILSPQYICRALLDALGEEDASTLAADWHPDGDKPAEGDDSPDETTEAALARAIGQLQESLDRAGVQA